MFPKVWQRIDVGEYPSQPATLPGFRIFRVKNAVFPGILRGEPDDQVSGLVYMNLDDDALFELDAYESDLYRRIPVIAATEHGPVECTAYVIPDENREALTNEFWDAHKFEQYELEKYLNG